MAEKLIYNSILIYNYLPYLRSQYPHIDREELLLNAGIEPWELDPGHWFSQEDTDRFYEVVLKATQNINVARDAGRYAAFAWPNNFMRQMALSFLSPINFYGKLSKTISLYVKGMTIKGRKVSNHKYEVCMFFDKGMRPKKYQCDNFQGYLEAITMVYRKKIPIITHDECFFKNSDHCTYIIEGTRSIAQYFNALKYISLIAAIPGFFLSLKYGLNFFISASTILITFLLLGYLSVFFEKKGLLKTFAQQELKPSDIYKGYSKYYSAANIVKTAAYNLARTNSVSELIERLSNICLSLGHKSGIIGIINPENAQAFCEKAYIFKSNNLKSLDLTIEKAPLSSLLSLDKTTVRRPSYFENILPSLIYEQCIRCKKILFVPIISDKSLLGFIILEVDKDASLQASDLFLIDAIASQTALSLINIHYFSSLLNAESVKNDFLTSAMHELLTPIQVANAAIHYINMKKGKDITNSIRILNKAFIKLNLLGKNLIGLSKSIEKDFLRDCVNGVDVFEQIKEEANSIASAYSHNITYSIIPIKTIECNHNDFVRAIINLIQNAAKYTPAGGEIQLTSLVTSAEFIIAVKDNGVGIPIEFHKKIFLRFFQIEPNQNGSGIGLYFCSDVVRKHGGYLTVESPIYPNEKIRKGTEFIMHLPVSMVAV